MRKWILELKLFIIFRSVPVLAIPGHLVWKYFLYFVPRSVPSSFHLHDGTKGVFKFHDDENCVDKWLKTNRTCPICRKSASENIDVGVASSGLRHNHLHLPSVR
uniref:RING-type domain-containing protein n=1 Tax=Parascaris equorum TaxID=6256 RepID=A0A914RH16_PAREQ